MGALTLEPGVARGDARIFNAVKQIVATLPHDYVVISWQRVSMIAGTNRLSNHARGMALDIRPKGYSLVAGSPCGGSVLDPDSMKKLDVLAAALRANAKRYGLDEAGGALWRTCTGGNHYDHVHTGSSDDVVNAPGNPIETTARNAGGAVGEAAAELTGVEGLSGGLAIGAYGVIMAFGLGIALWVIMSD